MYQQTQVLVELHEVQGSWDTNPTLREPDKQ